MHFHMWINLYIFPFIQSQRIATLSNTLPSTDFVTYAHIYAMFIFILSLHAHIYIHIYMNTRISIHIFGRMYSYVSAHERISFFTNASESSWSSCFSTYMEEPPDIPPATRHLWTETTQRMCSYVYEKVLFLNIFIFIYMHKYYGSFVQYISS
jgi:hypothetical protein